MKGAYFQKLAKLHRIRARVELVELQAQGGNDAQVVALVVHPHDTHNAVTARCFALHGKILLCVAVVYNRHLVGAEEAGVDERGREAHLPSTSKEGG